MAEETPAPAPAHAGQPPAASSQPQPDAPANPPQVVDAKSEATADTTATEPAADALDQLSIEELLKQASFEDPAALADAAPATDAEPFKLPNFQQVIQEAQVSNID